MTPKQYIKQFVKIYDNGGASTYRYTAVYTSEVYSPPYMYQARSMADNQYNRDSRLCGAIPHRRLGKRIQFKDLPPKCQELVMSDIVGILGDYK